MTRLAEHFGLDVDEMQHVQGPKVLNRRIMTNIYFIGPVQGEHCYKCPLPNTQTIDVRLPLPQAFTVSTHDMWVLSTDEINEHGHTTMFGNDVHPDPAPEWDAAAAGHAHGWDAWANAPQFAPPPAPQFAPQPAPQFAQRVNLGKAMTMCLG